VSVTETVVRAEGLGKRYVLQRRKPARTLAEHAGDRLRDLARRITRRGALERQEFWALRDVSLEIGRGEILGVVGRNGAGKSTLLKVLSRITEPTEGTAEVRGRVGSLLEVGTGFHPELSGRDNVFLNGAILGMRRGEIARKFDDIVDFAGVEQFIDMPVKRYSSGMHVRLGFAVAAFLEPEILLVDEVLSVGDRGFQERCLGRMQEVTRGGRTVVFVSHNLAAVQSLCTRAVLLDGGHVVHQGDVSDVLSTYVAATDETARTSLRERADRRGDGRLRFVEVEVRAPHGAVRAGDDVEVLLRYESGLEAREVLVGVSVAGPLGEPLFLVSNDVSGQGLPSVPAEGVFRCTIPRLALQPGRYSLNVFASLSGSVADWIDHAHFFTVEASDFFGTGRLPPATHGPLLVEHSWEVVPADVEARV
jgi:lipopolysaccharide transport system ATP-binding protein